MRTLRITAVAGSVLLWFAIPSFGQTNLMASLSRPATGIGSSGTWTANAIAAITLINNSSKPADKNNTLFADGHFRNSSDNSQGTGKPGKPHDPPQNPHDPHGGSVSAAEGGAATNYLILAGIACCAAIFLKRKQWDGRDQA